MSEPTSLLSVLHDLGPWILSLIAILQLWVIKAIERWRRGVIEIFETKNIEVGHGSLGPGIGLLGTLRTLRKEVFVREMNILVERDRDHANLQLSWWAFRSSTAGARNLEPVFGFLVSHPQPSRYDLYFADAEFMVSTRARLEKVGQRWTQFLNDRLATLPDSERVKASQNPGFSEALFSEFLRDVEIVELYQEFDRRTYWEAGSYVLSLRVLDADDRTFSKSWKFELTADDAKRLHGNAIGAIREACNLPPGYASAYPSYQPDNPRPEADRKEIVRVPGRRI
jgi:hypothetical protein